MKRFFLCFLLLLGFQSKAQKLRVVTFADLEQQINVASDTTLVLHFWATWCRPCVAELPVFQELSNKKNTQKFKIILVSLDFLKDREQVEVFLKEKNITAEVLLLNAPDANLWINKIDPAWSGGIPATLLTNKTLKTHKFIEKQLDLQEILQELAHFK